MAYSEAIPPTLLMQAIAGANKVWMYRSADAETAFDDTDYITNATELGMDTGDFVLVVDTTNSLSTMAQVTVDADGNGTLTPLTAIT